MEVQIIQPVMGYILLGVGFAAAAGMFVAFFKLSGRWDNKRLPIIFTALGSIFLLSSIGSCVLCYQGAEQNNANFSKQLMDEYHASSSKSFGRIQSDFADYNESSVVFTRDGQNTIVIIKRIDGNAQKVTMAFTVVDEKSLYPKK